MCPVPHHHMDISHRHVGNGHAAMVADFRNRFWISLILTVPILALPGATISTFESYAPAYG
jgi:P-type Cu2+ transporter